MFLEFRCQQIPEITNPVVNVFQIDWFHKQTQVCARRVDPSALAFNLVFHHTDIVLPGLVHLAFPLDS